MNKLSLLLAGAAMFVVPSLAQASCMVEGEGEVNLLSNFFPALELVGKEMKTCANDKIKVTHKATTEHKEEMNQAFAASTSPYDIAFVANSSITPIQAKGQLLPLNKYVEKYRDKYNIEDQMLIKFGDDIMAIAFMVNAQHLYYRKDILEKHGIEVPTTYDELLVALEKLKSDESIEFPYAAAYGNAWELAQEFMNIYLAMGGELFDPASAEAAFVNDKAIKTLELLKKLLPYMSPNAFTLDFGAVKQQLQQGRVAMAFLWGDQAPEMDNEKESKVIGKIAFAAAPSITKGSAPATTFWWDGAVIPRNLDGDPDLAFQVLMEGIKDEVVEANNDITLWIRSNYKPSKYSGAVIGSVEKGAPAYPMAPQASLAHAAIGDNIGDFLTGQESAMQSLQDAEKSYRQAAVDAGMISK